jgi:hypothetical protein
MTSHRAVVLIFATLTLPTPATAQGSTSDQAEISGAPAPTADTDRLVCKYELKTGTRFKERSCKSFKEWEAQREQHRRAAHEMIDTPKICGGGGNPEGC